MKRLVGIVFFSAAVLLLAHVPLAHAKDYSWGAISDGVKRFQILQNFGGLAVLDNETGLVWQKSPIAGNVSYAVAVTTCMLSTVGSRC